MLKKYSAQFPSESAEFQRRMAGELPELALAHTWELTTEEIARAFLVGESAMEQRITRAKRRVTAANVPFETPGAVERIADLDADLQRLAVEPLHHCRKREPVHQRQREDERLHLVAHHVHLDADAVKVEG